MGDMEPGMIFPGKFHCQSGTLIASLSTTDLGMMDNCGVVTIFRLGGFHIAVDEGGILTVSHQGQGCCTEDTLQCFLAVYQHIARRRAHEEFDARDTVDVQLGESLRVIIRRPIEKAVVDMTLLSCQGENFCSNASRVVV